MHRLFGIVASLDTSLLEKLRDAAAVEEARPLKLGHLLPLHHGCDGRTKPIGARKARGRGRLPRNSVPSAGARLRNTTHIVGYSATSCTKLPQVALRNPIQVEWWHCGRRVRPSRETRAHNRAQTSDLTS